MLHKDDNQILFSNEYCLHEFSVLIEGKIPFDNNYICVVSISNELDHNVGLEQVFL